MGLITGPLRRRARRHFAGLALLREDDANSFGVESGGAWQVRGNGTLGLSADELLFAQWVPNRVLRIPRSAIAEVTTGLPDSIALWVADLGGWAEPLRG